MAEGNHTMLDLINQKVGDEYDPAQHCADNEQKAELLHFGSEQNMSSLQDLSNMLYTRGRLQELSCTFSSPGELLTYGHPATLQEFEQLLRLGPIYDEQWTLFFHPGALSSLGDQGMWPDIRTLKRVLTNEGVKFGQDHRRLTIGDGSSKLHRLCAAYDDLYKLWSATLPEGTLTAHREEEETLKDAQDDSGCFMEDDVELGDGAVEPVMDDFEYIEQEINPPDNAPRNIGWRFSDDIEEATAARYRHSLDLSDDDFEAMEATLAVAVAVPLSPKQAAASTNRLPHSTLQPRRRYGPSPLQVSCGFSHKPWIERLTQQKEMSTISMIFMDGPKDGALRKGAQASEASTKNWSGDLIEKKPKKGLRGWARGVWEKAWSPMQDAQMDRGTVGSVGGWW
ncbi:hypothetical protein DE146DRAFT_602624 [Phaeosphaeria sp. MPI-PUGE-AT-0046c]|nr:hypothetical protein DE146DRAFT_602624 [Phaeosphaeria sp. MPI-PUGE-AT-0046c]